MTCAFFVAVSGSPRQPFFLPSRILRYIPLLRKKVPEELITFSLHQTEWSSSLSASRPALPPLRPSRPPPSRRLAPPCPLSRTSSRLNLTMISRQSPSTSSRTRLPSPPRLSLPSVSSAPRLPERLATSSWTTMVTCPPEFDQCSPLFCLCSVASCSRDNPVARSYLSISGRSAKFLLSVSATARGKAASRQ